jgi:hypothetical protein
METIEKSRFFVYITDSRPFLIGPSVSSASYLENKNYPKTYFSGRAVD